MYAVEEEAHESTLPSSRTPANTGWASDDRAVCVKGKLCPVTQNH